MIKHGESALSTYLKCEAPFKKGQIDLAKKVCLVLGSSNENVSITRGIAKTLSEAGAIVYVTETKNNKFVNKLSTVTQQQRSRGVIPIQGISLDSTNESELHSVFEYIEQNENGSLDLLINNSYDYDHLLKILQQNSGDELKKPPWEHSSQSNWDHTNQFIGLRNYCVCLELGSRMMVRNGSGLIVNVAPYMQMARTLNHIPYQIERSGYDELTLTYSSELQKHNVSILSLWVGPINNNQTIDHDSAPGFTKGESSELTGLAISHLASDADIIRRSGKIITTTDVAMEYDFTDIDGSVPKEFSVGNENDIPGVYWFSEMISKFGFKVSKSLTYHH